MSVCYELYENNVYMQACFKWTAKRVKDSLPSVSKVLNTYIDNAKENASKIVKLASDEFCNLKSEFSSKDDVELAMHEKYDHYSKSIRDAINNFLEDMTVVN